MLKIGVQSSNYFEYMANEKVGLEKAKAHGYDCLDYGGFASPSGVLLNLPLSEYEKYLLSLKKDADEVGIEFNQAHGLWYINEKSLDDRKRFIEYYKKQIIGCNALGCHNLVIHPSCPGGWIWEGGIDDKQISIDANVEIIEQILPLAKKNNVNICIENLPFRHYSLSETKEVKELVRMINDENIKICFDTGHSNCMGENLYESLALIKNELACLHVHDDFKKQDRHLIPFFGEIDWHLFAKGLKDISFDGVISLETAIPSQLPESIREEMQKSLANVARYLTSLIDNA